MTTSRRAATKRAASPRPGSRRDGPPWRPISAFLALLAIVYGLIFFTGGGALESKLGIDLQGGTRVTLTARTEEGQAPQREQLEQAKQIIEQRVNGLGVAGSEVVVTGNNLVITVPGEDGSQARSLAQTARLFVRPVVQQAPATPQEDTQGEQTEADEAAADEALQTGQPSAAAAAAIAEQRELRQAPEGADTAPLQEYMARMDCSEGANDPLRGNDIPDQYLVACGVDDNMVYLLAPEIIDGRSIDTASSGTRQDTGEWVVNVTYNTEASQFWDSYTANNVGTQTAFVLDSQVVSAPAIRERIPGGNTQVSGSFNETTANELANVLEYGSLPLAFDTSQAETVSATLGLSSLRAGLIAGAVGLLAVFIYALGYYRMLGILTIGSLILAGAMVYGIIVLLGRWIGFTLDLAGVAGLIIGIGMTADSFVVYFERIKDEMREGRSFRSAVPRGWASAKRTIWSGNAVSFIAAVIIYMLAVGEVRGFAFTLGLTTVLDVVVVFMVTHPLVVLATRSKFLSKPNINGLGAVSAVARERRDAAFARQQRTVKEGASS